MQEFFYLKTLILMSIFPFMFYIKEIYCRSLFIMFLIFSLFFIYYNYKETTLIIFLMPSKLIGYDLVEFFIYTNPTELLFAFLNLNLFLVLFSITPYLFWTTLDFLRTGLRLHEYNQAKKYFVIIGTILFSSNILLFTILFPIIFRFFKSFNVLESPDIFIKFELKIIEFIYFIYNVFYVINIGLFIMLVFIVVISLNGPVFYLKYKKVFLLSNILLATILSTPEVGSQLVLFFILIISLEMLQFTLTFIIKVNKVTY